jgi:hypothetical protein
MTDIPSIVTLSLPERIRGEIEAVASGLPRVEEVRLHRGRRVTLTSGGKNIPTPAILTGTEIDRTLRNGGFICFGDNYQRVSGDSRTALRLLEKIPEMQRDATSAQAFASQVRNRGIVYFTDELCHDLYRNRIDYRKLMDRREQWKKDQQMENFLKDVGTPLF